jgi:lysine-N-methylase
MEKQDKATFYDVEKKDEAEVYEDYEEFDVLMFGILHDARNAMIDIMQDRTMDISLRTSLVWSMACDMQDSIDEGAIFACEDIVEVYKQLIGDAHKAKDTLQQLNRSYDTCQSQERYEKALDMFKYLYQLEVLNEDWERDVDETSLNLFGVDSNHYENISQEFKLWLDDNKPNWQIQCEQIVVYFLATYLCGAVYDGRVAAKAKMSVASVFYIYEMLLSKWIKQGRELSEHDIIEMVYRYSRELEHSDINLDELEYCFDGYFDSDDID